MKGLISAFIFGFSLSGVANAAFVVTNDPLGGNGYVDEHSSSDFTLYSSNSVGTLGTGLVSLLYTDTALIDSFVSFNWRYFTNDIGGSNLDPAGYIINGVKTQLSIDGAPQYSLAPVSSTGFSSFLVNAGDTFGFYADATDNQLGRGQLDITNFAATAVPEPESYAMFLAGLGLLGFVSRRKTS